MRRLPRPDRKKKTNDVAHQKTDENYIDYRNEV